MELCVSAQDPVALGQCMLAQTAELDRFSLTRRCFRLPDLVVEGWFSDPGYAALCERNLAHIPLSTAATADVTLYLLDAESVSIPIPRWPLEVLDRQQANRAWANAGLRGAYLHDPRVWQFYSPQERVGVQLIRQAGATPLWESGAPLRTLLHWAYCSRGRRLCHAATLGHGGRGVLLVGAGGSGKSGTTLAGIAAGLDSVGDDYCLVENAEQVSAYPLFRILKQDTGGVQRAFGEEVLADLGPLNWQKKFEIHDSQLARSPFVPRLEIAAIVLPRVAHQSASTLHPITAGETMRAFAPSSAFQLPDGEAEAIAFTAGVCRRLPCYEMRLSTSAAEIANTLSAFLKELPS